MSGPINRDWRAASPLPPTVPLRPAPRLLCPVSPPRRWPPFATRAATLLVLSCVAACDREDRTFDVYAPRAETAPPVQLSPLTPGNPPPALEVAAPYQENRFAVGQGQTWYTQFNCAGCHSPGGGGGMGPPFTDSQWIYGSEPENIYATIVEGRPNGMPSFRGKLTETQVWELAAFVRSLSGLTPIDTWSGRSDDMQDTSPPREPGGEAPRP